ncbi:BatD family protein [Lentimicrobium sp.]
MYIQTLAAIVAFMLWPAACIKAQKVTADSSSFLIGEQVNVNLELTIPIGAQADWPVYKDTLTRFFEIIKTGRLDTVTNASGDLTIKQVLTITSFDTGYHAIPPLTFMVKLAGSQEFEPRESNPLLLEVKGVNVDQNAEIKDIKPIISVPYTFADFLPWILGVLGIVLLAFLIWYYIRRRKSNKPLIKIPSRPPPPAHIIAMEQLEALRKKQLWQKGQLKDYYTSLTDILRAYLQAVYDIPAAEMTSYEILQVLKKLVMDESRINELKRIFELADMVKFARARPLGADNELSFTLALSFVKSTAPATKQPENNAQEVSSASIDHETEKRDEPV